MKLNIENALIKLNKFTCVASSMANAICVEEIDVDADSSHIFSTLCASSNIMIVFCKSILFAFRIFGSSK